MIENPLHFCRFYELFGIISVEVILIEDSKQTTPPLFLSDYISPFTVLAHSRLLIKAGVGAGKNTFFETGFPNKNVLIATSRAAKVEQARAGNLPPNVTYCTYATLAIWWLEYCKTKKMYTSYRGNEVIRSVFKTHYDVIVFDEMHALVVDATFAEDRNVVFDFLQYAEKDSQSTIVLLSATPQPLLSYCREKGYYTIDAFGHCRNLVPRRIKIRTQEQFVEEVGDQPFSYFANFRSTLGQLLSWCYKKNGLKHPDIFYAGKKTTEAGLPNEVFSTSVLREAVNINNTETAIVAVESHDPLEIYQYAGRFRGSVDTLYVIWNARQNTTDLSEDLEMFYRSIAKSDFAEGVTRGTITRATDDWLVMSPSTSKVGFNDLKYEAIKRRNFVLEEFKETKGEVLTEYFGDVEIDNAVDLGRSSKYGKAFETSEENYLDFRKYIVDTLGRKNLEKGKASNYVIDIKTRNSLVEKAKEYGIVNRTTHAYYERAGALLKYFGFDIERMSKNKKSPNYYRFRVVKIRASSGNVSSGGGSLWGGTSLDNNSGGDKFGDSSSSI